WAGDVNDWSTKVPAHQPKHRTRNQHDSGSNGLGPKVRGNFPSPGGRMGHVVNLSRERRIERCLSRWLVALLGEDVSVLSREARRFEQIALDTHIEKLGLRALVRLAYGDFLRCDRAAYFARWIIEIAGENGLCGANDDASRLQACFHTMRAEIALGCGIALG